jgi:hypothetical protein
MDAIRIHCRNCHTPLAELAGFHSGDPEPRRNLRRAESGILRLLRGASNSLDAPFRVYEDLAFLFFANWLPASSSWIVDGLGAWGGEPGLTQLTPTFRKTRLVADSAYAFPLAIVTPDRGASLLGAATAVVSNEQEVFIDGPRWRKVRACLTDLFEDMDDPLREELVFRANRWPTFLRERVRHIINRPGIYHHTRWHPGPGAGWANSEYRLRVNNGKIPMCDGM